MSDNKCTETVNKESTAHIRAEIKRAFDELKADMDWRTPCMEKNIEVTDCKVDIALWAIHAVLRLLDQQEKTGT